MHWPVTPTEHLSKFQPSFCPWRRCPEHRRRLAGYRFYRHGFFSTKTRRRIPRFRCLTCERTFSRQTFCVSYYRKRPWLLGPVAAGIVAGSALRQLARSLECSPNTVARISAHLGRHAMLLQASALGELRGRITEPINLDHFETFEFTQDYPFGVATPVGMRSWFVYGVDPAPHGRGGRRSESQARRLRGRPRRATHGRYGGSATRVLDLLLGLRKAGTRLCLTTDGHPDYARSVQRHPARKSIELRAYPNPPRGPKGSPRSAEAQARDRAMFAVDLLHKILRHSLAHQRRESIAFARRLNAAMERFFLTIVWRNFVKKRSERRNDGTTPATRLGLTEERWSWKRVLARRMFYDRESLPEPWPRLYRRDWTTPLLANNAHHRLSRAF